MATTTNLGITLVEQAQAQKEVTINQAFSVLDAVVGRSVIDKDLATPPVSPIPSALYIVAANPTGAWAGRSTQLAYFDQIWRFIAPQPGMRVWVQDEALDYRYTGSAWVAITLSGGGNGGGGSGNGDMVALVYDPANIAQQVVGLNATQTLTNKTLTSPIISTIRNSGTITLPLSTDTLIGRTTTDTLSNKTINGATNTLSVRLGNDVTGNLPVTNLAAGVGASATTYWRGDGVWATPAGGGSGGSGNVIGAVTTTMNAIGKWGDAAGTSLVNSGIIIDAANNVTGAGQISCSGAAISGTLIQTGGASGFTASASSTAATARHAFTGAADTLLTASTEAPNVYFNLGQVRQHATGALALQRDCRITPSTHSFVATSTLTDAYGTFVDGAPIAGSNATITNSYALGLGGRSVGAGVTNSYGLVVNPNTGATNNFGSWLRGITIIDNFRGTTTNNNAATGTVGEFISGTILAGAAVALTSGVVVNITSISLTAGDWDVNAAGVLSPAVVTNVSAFGVGVSTTSAAFPPLPSTGYSQFQGGSITQPFYHLNTGVVRVSIAATTNVFLVGYSNFTTSINAMYGQIRARRVR